MTVHDGVEHLLLGVAEHVINMMFQLMSCLSQSRDIFTYVDFLQSKNSGAAGASASTYQSLQWCFTRFQRVKIVLIAMKA